MAGTETAELMLRLAVVLGENGRFAESEGLYRDALERQSHLLGAWHETTLSTLHGLAVTLRNRATAAEEAKEDRKQKAKERRQRRRERKKEEGRKRNGQGDADNNNNNNNDDDDDDDDDILAAEGGGGAEEGEDDENVAALLEEAEQMHRTALEGQRETLGPSHDDTCRTMNNLAVLLHESARARRRDAKGFRAAAAAAASNANALAMKAPGRYNHLRGGGGGGGGGGDSSSETMSSGTDDTNDYEAAAAAASAEAAAADESAERLEAAADEEEGEAEALYREVLACRRETHGSTHPTTMVSVHNLAVFLKVTGQTDACEALYREELRRRKREVRFRRK